MDIKLKYRAWVGEKHADIASPLTNSDIETYATEFAEWLVKNLAIPDVSARTLGIGSAAAVIKAMPLDQAIQLMKSDITGLPQTQVIDGELIVAYAR